jgi:hypothetical protein
MSTWLSEKEFRQSGAESAGITINVAFLQEIKSDFGFRDLLNDVYHQLKPVPRREVFEDESGDQVPPRVAAEMLGELRDGLETYFALEEFYGYFQQAEVLNPCVSQKAFGLQSEHETLFLKLNQIVETAQQIVYHEAGPETTFDQVAEELESFCIELAQHEQAEMDLMMRLCNEDIGVGD